MLITNINLIVLNKTKSQGILFVILQANKRINNMEQLFGKTTLSVVEDPFNAKCIERISMTAERAWFGEVRPFKFKGRVEFENDKTEGVQRFEASNLGELYKKIAEFCKSLE